jgi:folate-binding protein YgfZ
MAHTPLHLNLLAAGGQIAGYQGVETAVSFGDAPQEFVELRAGCAIYDLGWRGKIVTTGADRVRWLNGMLSNNVRDLAPEHGNYNFLLNAQGRILGDMYVYNRGDYLLLDTARWQAPKLLEVLNQFIIMDEVELTDISDKLTSLAVQGPRAREVLRDAGVHFEEAEPLQLQDVVWNDAGMSITRVAGDIAHTYEIWIAPANGGALWDALVGRGARPVGTEALEMFRVAAGVPRYGQDITERYLPQETAQEQALNFSKGCYIGQEIVERIRSRALLHRRLAGFLVDGPPPAPGTKIRRGDKDVGEITSAVAIPGARGDLTIALGYIRTDAQNPGTEVEIGGAKAQVTALPLKEVVEH